MENIKVSIIVPVYNAEKSLRRCVDSLINQTYSNIEIILVNDGSSDESLEICRLYSEKDSRVMVIDQQNGGPSSARNKGINCATGEYLTFVDADDYVELDLVEKAVLPAQKYNTDMVMYSYYKETKDKQEPYTYTFSTGLYQGDRCKEIALELLDISTNKRVPPYSWVRLIKRDMLIHSGLKYDARIYRSEDFFFVTQLHFKISSLYLLADQYLYHYIYTEGSITNSYVKDYWKMGKVIYDALLSALPKDSDVKTRLDKMLVFRSMLAIHNLCRSGSKKEYNREATIILRDVDLNKAASTIKVRECSLKKMAFYVISIKYKCYWLLKMLYGMKVK